MQVGRGSFEGRGAVKVVKLLIETLTHPIISRQRCLSTPEFLALIRFRDEVNGIELENPPPPPATAADGTRTAEATLSTLPPPLPMPMPLPPPLPMPLPPLPKGTSLSSENCRNCNGILHKPELRNDPGKRKKMLSKKIFACFSYLIESLFLCVCECVCVCVSVRVGDSQI